MQLPGVIHQVVQRSNLSLHERNHALIAALTVQVEDLKQKLAAQEEDVSLKNQQANELLVRVGAESQKTAQEREVADEEERKVGIKAEEVREDTSVSAIP